MKLVGAPRRAEFDQYTIKFTIGTIAFLLPWIEMALTRGSIRSISEAFWYEGPWPQNPFWPRSIFVGFLFSISALLLSYNGKSELEMWLGKLASICALVIALFPCECPRQAGKEILKNVHLLAAGAMFVILSIFCVIFWQRAKDKGHIEARRRMNIYAVMCIGMIVTIGLFVVYVITGKEKEELVLYGETLGLVSFGVSWLTASRVLPFITRSSERTHLFVRTHREQTLP